MIKIKRNFGNSLSNRLMIYSFIFTYALLISFWTFLFFLLKHDLIKQDKEILKDRINTISSLLLNELGPSVRLSRRITVEWFRKDYERVLVRVIDPTGKLIVETPDLNDRSLQILNILENTAADMSSSDQSQRLENGNDVFQASIAEITVPGSGKYKIEIALDRTDEQKLFFYFRLSFVCLLFIGGIASLWIGRAIVRIALRPIHNISKMAARVNSERLNERIQPSSLPVEFRELAVTMNDMLDRLTEI